ncbi:hypothetical protein BDR26DRAFT_877784 [Obelidium mucronatum]|nr:hypothetical protein BDR26DRAFT_877784 [Obelidium mucronatum]
MLLQIPVEVLLEIVPFVDLRDLVRLACACSSLRQVLHSTTSVWQTRVIPSHLPCLRFLPSAAIHKLLVDVSSSKKRYASSSALADRNDLAVQDVVVIGCLDLMASLDQPLFSEHLKSLDMRLGHTNRNSFKHAIMKLEGLETLKVAGYYGQAYHFFHHMPNRDKWRSLTISDPDYRFYSMFSLESLGCLEFADGDFRPRESGYSDSIHRLDANLPMLHTLIMTGLRVSDSETLNEVMAKVLWWNRPDGVAIPGKRLQTVVVDVVCEPNGILLALDSEIMNFYLDEGCTIKLTGCILV